MSNPVVHFEMPAKDKKRASEFYSKVFGWNMQQMGPEMGDYLTAQTAQTDEKGMVQTAGAINGGFFDYKDEEGFNVPHLVISVENLEQALEAVKTSGGQILTGELGQIMDIPNVGRYANIKDPEDNIIGMLQPHMPESKPAE